MKTMFKHLTLLSLFITGLLFCFILLMTSCQKELIKVPDKTLYDVSFSPQLYGDVVPWLKKKDQTKGFTDFVHKFFNHVIRLRTSTGTFIIDVPIITPAPNNLYTYQLGAGSYTAEVLPITEATTTGNGSYTIFNNYTPSCSRAAIYTRSAVSFTVTGVLQAPVALNCVTDYACLQFDLLSSDYVTAGTPVPQVVNNFDLGFIAAHNLIGTEQASYQVLGQELANNNLNIIGNAMALPVTWFSQTGFWFDPTPANIYYMYYIPGNPTGVNIPNGTGVSVPFNRPFPSYMVFGLNAGTGSAYPTTWLKDQYNARTWVSNTTLRVSYSFGSFNVTQSDWFSTIITK